MIGKKKLTVRQFLNRTRYTLGPQNCYDWQSADVVKMVGTLVGTFLGSYRPEHPPEEVNNYRSYCLGAITTSAKWECANEKVILEGQQLVMTLLLMFIHLLRRKDPRLAWIMENENPILWDYYGEQGHNPHAADYEPAMEALYLGRGMEHEVASDTARNLVARYRDIETCFPAAIDAHAWAYFAWWLQEKVSLEVTTAYSEEGVRILFKARAYDQLTYPY